VENALPRIIPFIMQLLWKLINTECLIMHLGLVPERLAIIHSSSGMKLSEYITPEIQFITLILINSGFSSCTIITLAT
jgi:hypothetical protein